MSIPRRFRRILCPVDFSNHSRAGLRYASELARRHEGEVIVLFVNDPLLDAAAAAAAYDMKTLRARTIAELNRFVKRAGVPPVARMLAVNGHPAPVIQRVADRLDVDLVVMGSRGLSGATKSFFGSTTERTLRSARVPVMVVPRPMRGAGDWKEAVRHWPGATALIPIDLDDYDVATVRSALDVVRQMGAKPLFIYVVPPLPLPSWLRLKNAPPPKDRFDAAFRRLQRLAGATARGAECRLASGDPADQIATSAVSSGTGLVVMALSRSPSLFGPRRGSITYRLISKDVATVVAIPEHQRRR